MLMFDMHRKSILSPLNRHYNTYKNYQLTNIIILSPKPPAHIALYRKLTLVDQPMQKTFLESEICGLQKKKKNLQTVLKSQPQRYIKLMENQDKLQEYKNTVKKIHQQIKAVRCGISVLESRLEKQKQQELILTIEKEDLQIISRVKMDELVSNHFVFQPACSDTCHNKLVNSLNSIKLSLIDTEYINLGKVNFRQAVCGVYYKSQPVHNTSVRIEGSMQDLQMLSYSEPSSQFEEDQQYCFMHEYICRNKLIQDLKGHLYAENNEEQYGQIKQYIEKMVHLGQLIDRQSRLDKVNYHQNGQGQAEQVKQKVLELKGINQKIKTIKYKIQQASNLIKNSNKQLQSLELNLQQLERRQRTIIEQLREKEQFVRNLQNRHQTFQSMRKHDLNELQNTLSYLKQKLAHRSQTKSKSKKQSIKLSTKLNQLFETQQINRFKSQQQQNIETSATIQVDNGTKWRKQSNREYMRDSSQQNFSIVLEASQRVDPKQQQSQQIIQINQNIPYKEGQKRLNKNSKKRKVMLSTLDAEFNQFCRNKGHPSPKSNTHLKENNNLARLQSPTFSSSKKKVQDMKNNLQYCFTLNNKKNSALKLIRSPKAKQNIPKGLWK